MEKIVFSCATIKQKRAEQTEHNKSTKEYEIRIRVQELFETFGKSPLESFV